MDVKNITEFINSNKKDDDILYIVSKKTDNILIILKGEQEILLFQLYYLQHNLPIDFYGVWNNIRIDFNKNGMVNLPKGFMTQINYIVDEMYKLSS